ncbi:MAG: thiamine phosphate synthase [Gammaproteobacteria bacterium]|nr:thiamine phosphate synthase [Gammaproteobacteria bacterium]
MAIRGIYAITDSSLTPGDKLLTAVEQALAGGISLLQYRDKTSPRQLRLSQAKALLALCAEFDVPLLINDDVQLCLEAGAAGVHLGQSDTNIVSAREQLGQDAIIGVTCHADLELASLAQQAGASYVAFGRFFPSLTKPEAPPASLDILAEARTSLSLPIAAIGGITADNATEVAAAGADLLAVINYLFASEDIYQRARKLNSRFQQAI